MHINRDIKSKTKNVDVGFDLYQVPEMFLFTDFKLAPLTKSNIRVHLQPDLKRKCNYLMR